MPFSLIKGSSS
uniref:Uncharacterized protein n=1 Tax=Anguilla anguilla TaxID=7936 RepID=A0A0E9UR51_ANGAN